METGCGDSHSDKYEDTAQVTYPVMRGLLLCLRKSEFVFRCSFEGAMLRARDLRRILTALQLADRFKSIYNL